MIILKNTNLLDLRSRHVFSNRLVRIKGGNLFYILCPDDKTGPVELDRIILSHIFWKA